MIIIFSILVIIYLYFLLDSYQNIKNNDLNNINDKYLLYILSFVGSLLIFISGLIFFYISIKDKNINVELAFN